MARKRLATKVPEAAESEVQISDEMDDEPLFEETEAPSLAKRGKRMSALAAVAKEFKSFRPASQVLTRVRAVPTIFPQFDFATRVGGLPIERFTLLHGPSAGGKTYWTIGLLLSFLVRDHFAVLIDAERCYDSKTEVLTRRGFVRWPHVHEDDQIGCWDPELQSLVYEKPFELTRQRYKGQMRRVEHGGVDLLVTPKHKMYVRTKIDRGSRVRGEREIGWNEWALVPADELGDRTMVKYRKHAVRTEAIPFEEVPGVPIFPAHDDRMALLRLIGFFIGDGWVGKTRGRTNGIAFGLTKKRKVAYLRELSEELGWPMKEMSNRVYVLEAENVGRIFRAEFYDENDEKRIPEYLLDLNQDEAEALLDGLRNSDGSEKRGAWEYFSTSDQVAAAVQRLVIHAGGSAHIHRTEAIGMNRVMVLSRMLEPIINTTCGGKNTSLVDYDGEIFCAHTRTGIMMVRRNGKPVLSGNTTPITWLNKAMGDYAEHPGFYADRPKTYEKTVLAVRSFVNTVKRLRDTKKIPKDTSALIVVDSIRKLIPEDQFKRIMKEAREAGDKKEKVKDRSAQIKAAMNAAWLDELIPLLEETQTAMVVIARETEDPDADMMARKFGRNYKVGGGKHLYYDASMNMRVSRLGSYGKKIKVGDKDRLRPFGDRHQVEITKSKVSGKGEEFTAKCEFHISNGVWVPQGFDRARDLVEIARRFGIIEGTKSLKYGKRIWKGEDAAVKGLSDKDKDLFPKIEAEVRKFSATKREESDVVGED